MRAAAIRRTVLTASAAAVELGKVVLATGELEGHTVERPKKGDVYEPGGVSADKGDCEPLAQAFSGVPVGKPARSEQRVVSEEIDKDEQEMPSVEELAEMSEKEVEEATFARPRRLSRRCGARPRSARVASPSPPMVRSSGSPRSSPTR